MTEGHIITLITSGVVLWMLGGRRCRILRVGLWPLLVGVILLISQTVLWKAVLVAMTLALVTSLPYGEKLSWSGRVAVFSTYALPGVWLNPMRLLLTVPLSAVSLTLWGWLSRRYNFFTWKLWEAFAGLLQSMALIVAAM